MTRKMLMYMGLGLVLAGSPAIAQQGGGGAGGGVSGAGAGEPSAADDAASGNAGSDAGTGSTSSSDYEANNPPTTAAPMAAERAIPPAQMGQQSVTPMAQQGAAVPNRYLASNVIGRDVRNPQGEVVGEVEDLVLADNGRLDGVLISVGEFLGIGGKVIGVDPKHLTPLDDGLRISMSREQLNAAPDFSQRPVIIR